MSQKHTAITIGIMTDNYGRFICEAIDSVLAQDRTDWELIISDDASADNTAEVVKAYLKDPRIKYIHHTESLGQAGNWSFLLKQATAPVFAVLHADDQWLPGTLNTALAAFEENVSLDLLYGNWWRQVEGSSNRSIAHRGKAHIIVGHDEYLLQTGQFTCLVSAAFLSKRVVELAGEPDRDLKMMVDLEYFLRVALNAKWVQANSEPFTVYRVHARSTTAESVANGVWTDEAERLTDICAQHVQEYPSLLDSVCSLRHNLAKAIFDKGVTSAINGNVNSGMKMMERAIILDPTILHDVRLRIDWILCFFGKPAQALLRAIHCKRFR